MASDFDIAQAAAAVYAESLLELANEAGQAEDIADQLRDLKALWNADPSFASLMSSAAIDDNAREESLIKVFGSDRVHRLILNLMLVLNKKRRTMIFPLVCDTYLHKLDAQLEREQVYVSTAMPLDDSHRQAIRDQIKQMTGYQAILIEKIDPLVLGGVRIQVGDRLYDMTIRRRLHDMRAGLLAAGEKQMRTHSARFISKGS